MAASHNGFCSYKLSIHKKTNIIQIMTKNITIFMYLIFYHRKIVKLDHFMTFSLSFATVLWCSRCNIHRFVAAPFMGDLAREDEGRPRLAGWSTRVVGQGSSARPRHSFHSAVAGWRHFCVEQEKEVLNTEWKKKFSNIIKGMSRCIVIFNVRVCGQ